MPVSTFTVTPTPPTVLKLAPGEEGTFSFTITVLAAPDKVQDVTLRALVEKDGKREEVGWLIVKPQQTLSMPGGTTEVVTVVASPTAKSPQGETRIQLAVYDNERPHDNYTYSAPVICEIVAPATTRPPPPRPTLPRWVLPAVIAAGVLSLVAIYIGARGIANWRQVDFLHQVIQGQEERILKLELASQPRPRKLCAAVVINEWRDTILVDDNWTPASCNNWNRVLEGRGFQLGCLLPNGTFSFGVLNGGQPSPNCGW